MSRLTDTIERNLVEQAGLYLAVQEDDEAGVVLSGMVSSEELRQAALDIAAEYAGERPIVDDMSVLDEAPDDVADLAEREETGGLFVSVERTSEGESLEPGDFSDQELLTSADEAAGPERSLDSDEVAEGDEVYVPAIDPPTAGGEVLVGFGLSSTDDVSVERSSDGTLGDEAVREAILRELREDSMTTALEIDVSVERGVASLRGIVQSLEDAESAEEVAARVPGVLEVVEELDVANLE
jgi:osmotically-inducible protein OsmY